jgi:anti-sigma factor RsiW
MNLADEIAGLTCRQVLAAVGDYIDGDLAEAEREAVEGHLRQCTACERFGGALGAMVAAVRRRLYADPGDVSPDVAARLAERLAGEP